MNNGLKFLSLAVFAGALSACATSGDVDKKIADAQAATNKKIDSVEGQIEDLQNKQKSTDANLAQTNVRVEQLSKEAQDALKRAQEAGVLAKGKVVFQQTFSEDRVRFKLNSYELNKDSQTALDEFANKVKGINEQYWVEVQGHTDDTGGAKYNDDLGQRRADSVRRYLSRQDSVPLNRMSTISYGDTLPVASNKTKKGRSENRRVVLVVLE
ncbi:MAG: flagellar motor protein MotB [Acidobacteria bacterium]|nr:MAG: flagellar motor protein MotB [Acidobacteriota bacterium]